MIVILFLSLLLLLSFFLFFCFVLFRVAYHCTTISTVAMAWRFRYPRAVIARQLTALPTRSFATISSLKAQQPDFPCVDQHADRQARILADRQQRPPADPSAAPSPSFPCVDQHESRAAKILAARQLEPTPVGAGVDRASANLGSYTPAASGPSTGPEPSYSAPAPTAYKHFHYSETFPLDYGSSLPEFDIAYETWGTLSPAKDNVVLLHTGLSASSHAKSNADNPAEGWWESFIGPGPAYPIDTDRFFVICTNVLGGCYGSTGPSSPDPSDPSGAPYATRFPLLSIFDMVRAQFKLLDHLGVNKLYASIGSSMGGMQSLAAAWMEPERVGRVVSISGSARSSPASIALRYAQRSGASSLICVYLFSIRSCGLETVLMADPNWNRGFYYSSLPPHTGMKLARQIATITYRSGPEWEQRFGRRRRGQVAPPPNGAALVEGESEPRPAVDEHGRPVKPVLCPDFLIETYLDHQGEQFCLKYDANSLIYVSSVSSGRHLFYDLG